MPAEDIHTTGFDDLEPMRNTLAATHHGNFLLLFTCYQDILEFTIKGRIRILYNSCTCSSTIFIEFVALLGHQSMRRILDRTLLTVFYVSNLAVSSGTSVRHTICVRHPDGTATNEIIQR